MATNFFLPSTVQLPKFVSFDEFVKKASETEKKYVCADKETNFTAQTSQRMSVAEAMRNGHYVQHGLGYGEEEEDDESPDELVYGKDWDCAVRAYLNGLKCTQGLVQDTNPVWIRGDGVRAKTYTHNDGYLNFAMLLCGKKTFYVMSPEDAIAKLKERCSTPNDTAGSEHEMLNVYPDDGTPSPLDNELRPPDEILEDECGRRVAAPFRTTFSKTIVLENPGDMMVLPPNWWHYVVTDPKTVMVNWWYVPKAGEPCPCPAKRQRIEARLTMPTVHKMSSSSSPARLTR